MVIQEIHLHSYISMLFPMNVGVLFSTTPPLRLKGGRRKKN